MIWLLAAQLATGAALHYENANQDFAQRKFQEAASEVNLALHENPNMVPALVLKARLATFAQHLDVAKSCLITAITIDPASEDAQFYLGLLLYQENSFDQAVPPLQAAQKLAPKSPLPAFYLALTHEALGNNAEAMRLYQSAEELSPEKSVLRAEILVVHSRFLMSQGLIQESIAKDRLAIESDPQSRDAHYELAKGLDHEGDNKDAAVEAELALSLPEVDTPDAKLHYFLSNLYRKLDRPDLAKEHLEKFKAAQQAATR